LKPGRPKLPRKADEMLIPSGQRGLTLDDYLGAVSDVRRQFNLRKPAFGLKEVEAEPATKKALKTIINRTINQHGPNIYSKPHPLLAEAGEDIYSERISTSVYSGFRIRHEYLGQALRRAIELGLQTVVQLRRPDPKAASIQKRLRPLASALSKLAGKMGVAVRDAEVGNRIELWRGDGGRLLRVPGEIQWGAEALNTIARVKVTTIRTDSPNPQVSVALYLGDWIKASTGRPHYGELATLVQAAFCAAGMRVPRWVDRLPIEMQLKKHWRKQWIESISS